jgi:hypothetical protein
MNVYALLEETAERFKVRRLALPEVPLAYAPIPIDRFGGYLRNVVRWLRTPPLSASR